MTMVTNMTSSNMTSKDTTINADNFEDNYSSGLIFSIFEGLKEGCKFQIISNKNLTSIKKLFEEAKIENLQLESKPLSDGTHYVEVLKLKKSDHGCCGMCGGG